MQQKWEKLYKTDKEQFGRQISGFLKKYATEFRLLQLGASAREAGHEGHMAIAEWIDHFKEYFRPSLSQKVFDLLDHGDGDDGKVTLVAVHRFVFIHENWKL